MLSEEQAATKAARAAKRLAAALALVKRAGAGGGLLAQPAPRAAAPAAPPARARGGAQGGAAAAAGPAPLHWTVDMMRELLGLGLDARRVHAAHDAATKQGGPRALAAALNALGPSADVRHGEAPVLAAARGAERERLIALERAMCVLNHTSSGCADPWVTPPPRPTSLAGSSPSLCSQAVPFTQTLRTLSNDQVRKKLTDLRHAATVRGG